MKTKPFVLLTLLSCAFTGQLLAQEKASTTPVRAQSTPERGPPPQAYADCKGKQAGETVQHTTPEGKVAAVCEDTPKGMVARPKSPRSAPPQK